MNENYKLKIINMYPEVLNLYGDKGNIIALKRRCEKLGINYELVDFNMDSDVKILEDGDIILLGGASDREQNILYEKMLSLKDLLKDLIESGVGLLAVCGGYQLLGKAYIDAKGNQIKGLEIFDFYTRAEKGRLIGNVIIKNTLGLIPETVVGYENHGGRTYHDMTPLGEVIVGFGNNGKDKKEGLVYKNLIGTYLHGPILPKNPHIADFLIKNSLKRKYPNYNDKILSSIDDSIELLAHKKVIELYSSSK